LWDASDDIRMAMIATFGVSSAGVPAITELCLMPATRQWLPVEDGSEKQLLVYALYKQALHIVDGMPEHLRQCQEKPA
jgi:hypothetical protein